VPLGHPPYLNGKPEGDNSMAGKRGRCEGVDGVAAQDPCDMAKT
jgi:hypothetical protein